MAFCNSCGAVVNEGTKFCNQCGAAVAGAPSVAQAGYPAAGQTAPPSTGGSSALKIILIVIAVIVGLGILSVGAFSFFVYRVAKSAHVSQKGDEVKIDTPFGSIDTSKDAAQAAKNLGVDVYPGAEAQKNGSASMSFGSVHTVTASFASSDSVDKVCAFYRAKFPNAVTSSSDQNRCSIVSNDQKNMITISAQGDGNGTKFQISNVSKSSN